MLPFLGLSSLPYRESCNGTQLRILPDDDVVVLIAMRTDDFVDIGCPEQIAHLAKHSENGGVQQTLTRANEHHKL